jgi:hypothetical protein
LKFAEKQVEQHSQTLPKYGRKGESKRENAKVVKKANRTGEVRNLSWLFVQLSCALMSTVMANAVLK